MDLWVPGHSIGGQDPRAPKTAGFSLRIAGLLCLVDLNSDGPGCSMADSDEDDVCPLCCEDMDISDKHFIPCPCGYR